MRAVFTWLLRVATHVAQVVLITELVGWYRRRRGTPPKTSEQR